MSFPNHLTTDIEDAFSSNFSDYTTASPNYFPASPGNISSNPPDNLSKYLLASLAISPFYDMQAYNVFANKPSISPKDPITPLTILTPSSVLPPSLLFDPRYFFVPEQLLPPKKQIHTPSSSSTTLSNSSQKQACILIPPSFSTYTPTPPQIFKIGKSSIKMRVKHHEKQTESVLNYLEELSFHYIKKIEKRLVNGWIITPRDLDEVKTKHKEARTQILKLQKKHMGQRDKISFVHFRISDLEITLEDIQDRHQLYMPPKRTSTSEASAMTHIAIRKLVADSVAIALEAQAATMASTNNPNRNSGLRKTLIAKNNCAKKNKVKFAINTLLEEALFWWDLFAQPIGVKETYKITWSEFKRFLEKKYCPQTEIKKMKEAITMTQKLIEQVLKHNSVQETNNHKRKLEDRRNTTTTNNNNNYRNNNPSNDHHQQQNKRQETFRTYTANKSNRRSKEVLKFIIEAKKQEKQSLEAVTRRTNPKTSFRPILAQELALMYGRMLPEESDQVKKYVGGLPDMIQGNVMSARPKTIQEAIKMANDLLDQKVCTFVKRQAENKKRLDNNPKDNHIEQPPYKRQNVARAYSVGPSKKKENLTLSDNQRTLTCFDYGNQEHYMSDCPKLKNRNHGNQSRNGKACGRVYALGGGETDQDPNSIYPEAL
nr:reverse transcriptase domain-containing protein [Tanacetum cinerariifolium]